MRDILILIRAFRLLRGNDNLKKHLKRYKKSDLIDLVIMLRNEKNR